MLAYIDKQRLEGGKLFGKGRLLKGGVKLNYYYASMLRN